MKCYGTRIVIVLLLKCFARCCRSCHHFSIAELDTKAVSLSAAADPRSCPRSFLHCMHFSDQPNLTHTLIDPRTWEAFVSARFCDGQNCDSADFWILKFAWQAWKAAGKTTEEKAKQNYCFQCVCFIVWVLVCPFHRHVCFVFLSFFNV